MIDPKEVRIDTYRCGHCDIEMRICHIPTGIVVSEVGPSQYRLRKSLMKMLERRVEASENENE